MAELDATYRTPRHRPGMDPNTRKLALIAGGIGAALVVMVGAWSLAGGKSGGVPVIEADSRPLRVKPDNTQQALDMDEPTTPGKQALAPTPEIPNPDALRAQAERAAAEKLAAETRAAEKLTAEKRAAEQAQAVATQQAAAPPARPTPPAARAAAQAPPPARAPVQPVALTAPTAAAPTPTPPIQAARAPAAPSPAPVAATSRTQVQLGAVQSEQAARNEWARLEKRMPDILGGYRPALVKTEHNGKTFWRLRTGGFADTSQASSFCEKVRAKGSVCTVASF